MTPRSQQQKLVQHALSAYRPLNPVSRTSLAQISRCHAATPRALSTSASRLKDRPPFLPSQIRAEQQQQQPLGPHPPVYFADPQQPPSYQVAQPPPRKPTPTRAQRTRRLLFTATFLFLGITIGQLLRRSLIEPPNPPAPDTPEDAEDIDSIRAEADSLEIVQSYSSDPDWISWEAYSGLPAHQRAHHLCATTLRGSRGLGAYQRIFQHKVSGETMVIVFLGEGISGWPGVVHGGALATILDETMGRAAFTSLKMGPAGEEGSRAPPPGVTANLKIDYSHVSLAGRYYVVWARVKGEHELEPSERGKRDYKAYVEGVIEDEVTQRPCVYASALFVGPHRGKQGEAVEVRSANVMPIGRRF